MTKLKIDSELATKLSAPAELIDENGHTIGFLISPGEYFDVRKKLERRRRDYDMVRGMFTDEDREAAEAAGGEYTFEEVMEHLRSLEGPSEAKSA
jgi:hypothetical protein